jgi:hypothetical protein
VRATNWRLTADFEVVRARLSLDRLADRLLRPAVAARRHAGEHPLQHRLRQRVTVGEIRVRLQRQLAATIGAAHARPLDPDPPPAERDLAGLVPVAHRRAVGVVLALRPDDLLDLFLHQLGQHAKANTDTEREQPLLRRADQLAERFLHAHGQHSLRSQPGRGERYDCFLHGGSSLLILADRLERSQQERTRPEGPPSSSTSYGTTSAGV